MVTLTKKTIYILLFLCAFFSSPLSAEGLRFLGNGYPIEQRTSYDVFSERPVTFEDHFSISFRLSLYMTTDIGNILRIKSSENGSVFNLFYDGHGENHLFLFNEEGKNNLIHISLKKSQYPPREWLQIAISFDLENDMITLTIGDNTYSAANVPLSESFTPTLVFGKSDHIIDVAPFAIRNLSVGNTRSYRFPLMEYQGNQVHNSKGTVMGNVVNPYWLINDAYHWKPETSTRSRQVSGTNYHAGRKELYHFNKDSIIIYNLRTVNQETVVFKEPCPVDLRLGTNFIDPLHDKLYSYEVYYDSTYQGPTVASLDLNSYEWRIESYDRLPTQLHHHGSYFDPSKQQYLIFGGFGNMRYSNIFYRYDIGTHQWDVRSTQNEGGITPRYFTAMGHPENSDKLYLFGGMGNSSGDQLLGRTYYYDLYQLDLPTSQISRVWEIPWDQENMVPVRGMVIHDDASFYTLCYPEHFTQSYLRLYRYSLKNGDFTILGDSIPIFSDKINTNANLYYDDDLHALYAVVHEFSDDIASEVHVYSLTFPPITSQELVNYATKEGSDKMLIVFILAGIILLIVAIFLVRFLKYNRKETFFPDMGIPFKTSQKRESTFRANAIYLFGDFMVRNRSNRDITYLFSKKLKETFCLLLQFSAVEDGITSQHLSETLWPEKPANTVKNTRNVTLNRLRKILEELDGIELLYEKGVFKLIQEDPLYCDYTKCMAILSRSHSEEELKEFIAIVNRGKFLKNENDREYDILKENTEKSIEPLLIHAIEWSYEKEAYLTTVELADAAFHLDPVSDTAITYLVKALQKLKRNEEAKIRYLSFLIEYKKTIGREYPNPLKFV
ncbi:MAG: DNA-binding transcriptional activator [Clostridia bacterium]|nr:DNA-binding transcriptional activator [Clostridia bacterium]